MWTRSFQNCVNTTYVMCIYIGGAGDVGFQDSLVWGQTPSSPRHLKPILHPEPLNFLLQPQQMKDNCPYIALIRKNVFFRWEGGS